MNKIWHKPLHKRKVWKQMSLYNKTVYYLQPFLLHLINTWRQQFGVVPFPILFKIMCSGFLILLMLMPAILPIIITISYYAIFQCLIERFCPAEYTTLLLVSASGIVVLWCRCTQTPRKSSLGIEYPKNLDIVHKVYALFNFEAENENFIEYFYLYVEKWRLISTSISSLLDYVCLALAVLRN